jgi:hypothetical protein
MAERLRSGSKGKENEETLSREKEMEKLRKAANDANAKLTALSHTV